VLFDEDGSTLMLGSSRDAANAKRLRGERGPLLYVREGTEAYVVRDPATIDRVRAEMHETQEIAAQQAALGAMQAEMGRRQAEMAAHQGEMAALHAKEAAERIATVAPVHEQIAALTAALGALRISAPDTDAEMAKAQRALQDAIAALERSAKAGHGAGTVEAQAEKAAQRARLLSQELAAMDQKMSGEMQAMAERQAQLGREQGELGRAQGAAADAMRKRIRTILDEARAKGLAERVR
jgi:hypothetical protein